MITFQETGLRADILKGIEELGFEQPTPIQEKALGQLLESDQDLIACAQTGTGKTAAFSLPVLQKIDVHNNDVQCIILCPTRELCLQIARDIESYSKHIKGMKTLAVYGGTSIDTQIKGLKRGCQIVVGTPGRTLDLIKRRVLKIQNIDFLILDEADEMLSMGFQDDLDDILESAPDERQTLLFSATMPKAIKKMASKYMNDPAEISVSQKQVGTENVSHEYYVANAKNRYLTLKRIVDFYPNLYAIIFCRTRRETKEVAEKLSKDGYSSDALHGDLSQAQRDFVMGRFRTKQIQLLIATDVAARGIDVKDLTHVINYNLPDENDVYVHRSGRTGRANSKGISLAIIHSREFRKIDSIERKLGKAFTRKQIPSGKDICGKQLYSLINKVEEVEINESLIAEFIPAIDEKLSILTREELIKRFVSVEFNRFLSYYSNAPDLNLPDRGTKRNKRDRDDDRGFHINLGSKQDVKPRDLIDLVNKNFPTKSIEIGGIDIFKSFSFFEIENKFADKALEVFNGSEYNGVEIKVEISKAKRDDDNNSGSFRGKKERRSGGDFGGKRPSGRRRSDRSDRGGGGRRDRRK
ncbi:UNVERIFIED_CONTAM: hypothetical protein GTU68_022644 [Idotea baltica]|nr:hypothetical protein [Idotea baltica]